MLSRFQELSLIARCVAADDRHAFGQLVEAYADPLRRFLTGLTHGDISLADDLAQETFLKAYLAIRSLKGVARFRTWLFRIAYNEFLGHMRRLRPEEPLSGLEGCDPADDDSNERPISDANLAEALDALPPAQRAVVELFYYEDFTIARIAAVTGMPQGTVKSYLSRARSRLALLLEKHLN